MAQYPFKSCVLEYIRTIRNDYAESTLEVSIRRFNRMCNEFPMLKSKGLVSTANPKRLTLEDIKAYYRFLQSKNITPNTIKHDLNDLKNLCSFYQNHCVQDFYAVVPSARKSRKKGRYPSLSEDDLKIIYDFAVHLPTDDFIRMRAYALVSVYLSCGLRTLELQHCLVRNLVIDGANSHFYIDFVKGQDSYGQDRTVAVLPLFVPVLERYLAERQNFLLANNIESPFLFFNVRNGAMISTKTVAQIRRTVNAELSVDFDGRKCRRTYGQVLIDNGVPLQHVSVLMGHSTTNTTEKYYCRASSTSARQIVSEKLGNKKW